MAASDQSDWYSSDESDTMNQGLVVEIVILAVI